MKTMIKVLVWGGNLLFCLATMGASTQHFQVDEYGNIYANGAKLAPGVIAPDPVSGLSTLSYQLFLPINHGDIVLFEPGTTNISDILRFGGAALGTLFFFSDAADAAEPGNLADGPLPTPQANAAFFAESGAEGDAVQGLFGYFAFPTGIGGNPDTQVTWDFYSEGQAPEPSSLALLALGGFVALNRRRRA